MEVGKSEYNQTGLAGFLRPAIARGELLCVAECTPEQLPLIEREDPQLVDAFRQFKVEEPDARRGRIILDALRQRRPQGRPRRAAGGASTPSTGCTAGTPPTRPSPAGRCGSSTTCAATATARCRPPPPTCSPPSPARPACRASCSTRTSRSTWRRPGDWFARRVIGQAEAVDLVVDLLATVKAGLTRPNRPIASLLFIGPTGVGKTEMAKALAEFLFGSKDRLTRFDMSEYADPLAVGRLVGRGVRRRGAAHGQGPRAAVLRAAARRVREGPPVVLRPAAAGARRGPADRRRRPAGRLPQRGHHPDVEPRGRVVPGRAPGLPQVRPRRAPRPSSTSSARSSGSCGPRCSTGSTGSSRSPRSTPRPSGTSPAGSGTRCSPATASASAGCR